VLRVLDERENAIDRLQAVIEIGGIENPPVVSKTFTSIQRVDPDGWKRIYKREIF